ISVTQRTSAIVPPPALAIALVAATSYWDALAPHLRLFNGRRPGKSSGVAATGVAVHSWLGAHRLDQWNAKLLGGVPPQHACHEGFRDVGPGEQRDGVPGARGIVVRIARAPDHFGRKVVRQLLDESLLGVKPEHHVAFLPHLFGV